MAAMKTIFQMLKDGSAIMVNCGGCGKAMLSKRHAPDVKLASDFNQNVSSLPEVARGRINDKWYCSGCLDGHSPPSGFGENLTPRQAAKTGKTNS